MLWSIRANPAQARRSRKATCGSSNSPKESRRSPALAARSAVWARTKAASPTAAPKSSKSRCTLLDPSASRSKLSGKWQCRAAMSVDPAATSSHLARFKVKPMVAALASTKRENNPFSWMLCLSKMVILQLHPYDSPNRSPFLFLVKVTSVTSHCICIELEPNYQRMSSITFQVNLLIHYPMKFVQNHYEMSRKSQLYCIKSP